MTKILYFTCEVDQNYWNKLLFGAFLVKKIIKSLYNNSNYMCIIVICMQLSYT